jgi:hypothetical protein
MYQKMYMRGARSRKRMCRGPFALVKVLGREIFSKLEHIYYSISLLFILGYRPEPPHA